MSDKEYYFSQEFLDVLDAYKLEIFNPRTYSEIRKAVSNICNFCKKDFLQLDGSDVQHFFDDMCSRNLSLKTISTRKSFYVKLSSFIAERFPELNYFNPFAALQPISVDNSRISLAHIPSLEEVDAVLQASRKDITAYTILTLAFRVALTASQLLSLKSDYIHIKEGVMYLQFPPDIYGQEMIVTLPRDVADVLAEYLAVKGISENSSSQFVFLNKRGRNMSLRNLDKMTQKYVSLSNVEKPYTLRDLRSRSILDMVSAVKVTNGDIEKVGDYVGIKGLRLGVYAKAIPALDLCPAELVNLTVKPFSNNNSEDA